MDLSDRSLWPVLAVAAWLVFTPAILGFLAGSSLDRWCGGGCWGVRAAFTVAGIVFGWQLALRVLNRAGFRSGRSSRGRRPRSAR